MPEAATRLKWGVWGRGIHSDGQPNKHHRNEPQDTGSLQVDAATTAGRGGTNRSAIWGRAGRQRRLGSRLEGRVEEPNTQRLGSSMDRMASRGESFAARK